MVDNSVFRILNKEEKEQFRQWARDNYKPNTTISEAWHPVVRHECEKINSEQDPAILVHS